MNRQVVLARRPTGIAQADDFRIVEQADPRLQDGGLVVRNLFLSVEPAMRGWIADTGNYSAPVAIGSVMRALAVGEVVASDASGFAPGDVVTGWFGWQSCAAVRPADVIRKVTETDLPLSLSLGVLGINGVTALLALTGVGEPRRGDTVVVSTAAGGVGSAVGQIARLLGCRPVGITGSSAKVTACVERFGYDVAVDYRWEDVGRRLGEICADGVQVYFDNTAGAISDAVLPHLAQGGRVVVCGTAALSSWEPWPSGPRVERHLLVKRARMQGFVVFDHMAEWDDAVARLAAWVRTGELTYLEDVLEGIEACPDALAGLYRGENLGKRVIRL